MIDLADLDDAALAAHLDAVLGEQERRQRLANAPQQFADLAARYVADGGDREVLIEAVTGTIEADATA